jgi:hypothetical protein
MQSRCIGGNIGHDGRYTNMSDDQVGADTPALQQNGAIDPSEADIRGPIF